MAQVHAPPDEAQQLRAQAAQLRAGATDARAEADAGLKSAQAALDEAQRLIAVAQQQARQLSIEARDADAQAATIAERAAYVAAAVSLQQQIAEADATVVALTTKADDIGEQVAALDQRLAELGAEREHTAAQLIDAREAANIDEVTAHRTRLAAVDEVISTLQSQRQTARERLVAIGDADGTGELALAAGAWQSKQAELRRVQNWLNPARIEAQLDEFLAVLSANADRIATEAAQPNTDTAVVRTARR
jgi:chromosome segregation ATPase